MNTFWETFLLILITVPLALTWGFALFDIFRRDDMAGFAKVLWVVAIFVVPFIGTLVYVLLRPSGATEEERVAIDRASREFVQHYAPDDHASQLKVLADLHDRGKLTDDEFDAEKARLAGQPQPARVAS